MKSKALGTLKIMKGGRLDIDFNPANGHRGLGAMLRGAVLAALLASCQPFDYSPYTVPKDGSGTNPATYHNLNLLVQPVDSTAPFRFAVMADVQRRFGELAEGVGLINTDTSVRFVFMAGDMTQFGLNREYAWVDRELDRLHVPWFTVIGNHDAQANGAAVYRRRYGPLNYVFDYGNARFVILNTNGWEFPGEIVPDFEWLESALSQAESAGRRIFVVSHVGPFVHQLDSAQSRTFTRLMTEHGVEMSIHGHMHSHSIGRLYDTALVSVLVDNIGSRSYSVFTVGDTGTAHERIVF
jgi:Icc protein